MLFKIVMLFKMIVVFLCKKNSIMAVNFENLRGIFAHFLYLVSWSGFPSSSFGYFVRVEGSEGLGGVHQRPTG